MVEVRSEERHVGYVGTGELSVTMTHAKNGCRPEAEVGW